MERSNKTNPKPIGLAKFWSGLALTRSTRLLPLTCIFFWFMKYVFVHLGSGPIWDYGLNEETPMGACLNSQSWLTPFTTSTTYRPLSRQCLPTIWSVTVDLLCSCLVAPPIIWLLHRRPTFGLPALALAIIYTLGTTLKAYETLPNGLQWEIEQFNLVAMNILVTVGSYLRTMPEANFIPYAIGILAGYALFKWEQKERKSGRGLDQPVEFHSPSWLRHIITWTLISLSLGIVVTTLYADVVQRDWTLDQQKGAPKALFTVNHMVFSATFACLFLQMITSSRNNPLAKFFSKTLWKVLSKLNFSIMLTHWILIQYDLSIAQTDLVYYKQVYYRLFCYAYITSMAVGVPIYVLIESPIDRLIRRYVLALH